MKTWALTGAAMLLLPLSAAQAQNSFIPTFAYFRNIDQSVIEAYLVQCEQPNASGDLKCKMVDLLVSPNISKEKATERRRLADKEARALLADKEGLAQMCSAQPQLAEALRSVSNNPARRLTEGMKALCESKDLAGARKLVLGMIEQDELTCVVGTAGGWETTFTKKGSHTWVANNGPEGTCGRVTIETLEEDPTKLLSWNYTIRKATTTPANSPICANVPADSIMKYTWDMTPKTMNCEMIKFGLPGM